MKKALQTILIVMMSLLALVSCSQEKAISDQLVSATLISTDRVSKALETEVDFDLSAVKLWKYTATKANGGLKTGETGTGTENAVALTNGETKGLSQGAWNFVLYGYDAAEDGNLIAQGSINNATVTETNHEVTITVNPVQTSGATGKIVISNNIAIVSSDSKTTYKSGTQGYTMSYAIYSSTDTSMETNLAESDSFDVGSYKVVVKFNGTVNGVSYTAAKAEKVVNVYAGLTTTVKGTIGETEQAALLNQESGVYFASDSETVTTEKLATAISLTANSSPVGAEKSTKVSIPENALTLPAGEENSEVELTVVATEVATETSTFTLVSADEESPVLGAIDITLKVGNEEKTNFSSTPLTITTYVAKGLNGGANYDSTTAQDNETCSINVKYNGDGADGIVKTYNAESGELVFTVSHLSTYYVVDENAVVYDSTANQVYANLSRAVLDAPSGSTLVLLCNSEGEGLQSKDKDKATYRERLTIDFNNHTYTMTSNPTGSTGYENQAMHWGASLGSIKLMNGTFMVGTSVSGIKMGMQNYITFTAENMVLDFTNITPQFYGTYTGDDAKYNGLERLVWGNNDDGSEGSGVMVLENTTVKTNDTSTYGICASNGTLTMENSKIEGYASFNDVEGKIIADSTSSISKGCKAYFSNLECKTETADGITTYTCVEKQATE